MGGQAPGVQATTPRSPGQSSRKRPLRARYRARYPCAVMARTTPTRHPRTAWVRLHHIRLTDTRKGATIAPVVCWMDIRHTIDIQW